jgi:hypothetical protein
MGAGSIIERLVGLELIGIVATGFGGAVQHLLQIFLGPFPDHIPAHNTVRGTVNVGHDVDLVFLSPTKLYNLSNSLTFTCPLSWGGSSGSSLASALTQLDTV